MPKPKSTGIALLVGLVTFAFAGAWSFGARAPGRLSRAHNVVVVLVDTLRADHLSLYGYQRATSPHLDRRAERAGAVFENARSQAPCTFPSVNSLLTSRSPGVFVAQAARGSMIIPPAVPTLAELLAGAGYDTAAVSASPIVRAQPSKENPTAGFGAGFADFDESCYWGHAGCVTARAKQLLGELDEPFLLYLHYMDPHDHYEAPARFAVAPGPAGDAPATARPEHIRRGDPNPIARRLYEEKLDPGVAPEDLAYLVQRYDDEIVFFDASVEELFRALDDSGLATRTTVALVADHGEEFLEHGHIKHCRDLFDTQIRVPFLLFGPGIPARRVPAPVSNLDLVPTLLDLAGAGVAPPKLEGRSLRPLLENRGVAPALQFASWSGWRSAADGRFKLIAADWSRHGQLFDLLGDPGETTNVAERERARFVRLRRELDLWRAAQKSAEGDATLEAERNLRSLGYLQ